jgi:RNA polymerase sigma-70 factor (ECF subfamily)
MGVKVATVGRSDAEVYARYCDGLTRFAASLVGRDEAPDVVSDVMVRLLSKQGLHGLREPKPYLYRAVLNEARTHLRRRHDTVGLNVALPVSNPEPLVDPGVLRAVIDLPPQQRAAAYLTYWEGYTTNEVARLLGVRPGTVGRYLHLARRRLKRVLNED